MQLKNNYLLLWIVGVGLLFPLFFQLSGHIYNDISAMTDSGGLLQIVPLPISILACSAGIALLIKQYQRAVPAWLFLLVMLLSMLISLVFAGSEIEIERSKFILLLQVMLPVFGLVLGQLVVDMKKTIPKAFLSVLLIVVPVQLFSGWLQGSFALTHYLYLFSIYSHFQYVTLIFVCAFAYSTVMLWETHKKWLFVLTVLMGVYVTASLSFLTIFAFFTFIIFWMVAKLWKFRGNFKILALAAALGSIFLIGMFTYFKKTDSLTIWENGGISNSVGSAFVADQVDGLFKGKFSQLMRGEIPSNVQERFDIWRLYASRITESGKTILLGHAKPLPRDVRTSAHNWYLDMIDNFGLISVFPMIVLIGYTIYLLWISRQFSPSDVFWLSGIVFYLVLIDNNFKVTLRQPYPGLFAYFLWGLLLSKLIFRRDEVNAKFQ